MKIAIDCQSPLLQKALELFLAKHLCSKKHCDIVIQDMKCLQNPKCFTISTNKGADLVKPFSKSQLILALENRYRASKVADKVHEVVDNTPLNFDILEKRIESLTQEYQQNILKAVRAFYEK